MEFHLILTLEMRRVDHAPLFCGTLLGRFSAAFLPRCHRFRIFSCYALRTEMCSWAVTLSLQCCENLQEYCASFAFASASVGGDDGDFVEEMASESCSKLLLKCDECDHRSSLSLGVQIEAFQILDLQSCWKIRYKENDKKFCFSLKF